MTAMGVSVTDALPAVPGRLDLVGYIAAAASHAPTAATDTIAAK